MTESQQQEIEYKEIASGLAAEDMLYVIDFIKTLSGETTTLLKKHSSKLGFRLEQFFMQDSDVTFSLFKTACCNEDEAAAPVLKEVSHLEVVKFLRGVEKTHAQNG